MKKIISLTFFIVYNVVFSQIEDKGDKVGVGIDNPEAKLHVNSKTSNSELFRLDNNGVRQTSFSNYSDGTYDNAGIEFKKESDVGQFKFSNRNGNLLTILPKGTIYLNSTIPNTELLRLDNKGLRYTTFSNYSDGTFDNAGMEFKKESDVGQFRFKNKNGNLLTILPKGNIHVNNTSPNSEILRLDNKGLRYTTISNYSDGTYDNAGLQFKKESDVGQFKFSNKNGDLLTILPSGNVGINTKNIGDWQLSVGGKIRAEEVKVYTNWADFVFNENYDLPSLLDVEKYIKEKGHLKDIPSEEEVKKNGVFLGQINSKLLQKIEELTIYSIEQEKRINKLESLVEKLIREENNFQK